MSSLAQVRMMFNSPEAFNSPLLARTSLLLLLQSTRPSSGYMRFHEWPGQCECGRSLILCHLNKTDCYCFSGVNNGASKNLQGRSRGGIKGTPELVAAKQLFREHFRFQWPLELTLVAVTVTLVCYNVSCAVLQNRAWQPFSVQDELGNPCAFVGCIYSSLQPPRLWHFGAKQSQPATYMNESGCAPVKLTKPKMQHAGHLPTQDAMQFQGKLTQINLEI